MIFSASPYSIGGVSNILSDSGYLGLLLFPRHFVPGHAAAVDHGRRGQWECGTGIRTLARFIRISSILIGVPLALELIDSIILGDFIIMDNMSQSSHPWRIAIDVAFSLFFFSFSVCSASPTWRREPFQARPDSSARDALIS